MLTTNYKQQVVLLLVLAACSSQNGDREVSEGSGSASPPPAASPVALDAVAKRQVMESAPAEQTRIEPAPNMVIRNGIATVEVADLDTAVAAVRRLAQRFGGYLTNTSVNTGKEQVPAATLEVKVPAARFDSALAALQPLGKVVTVNTTAEDVGEHFVDVTARLANARRLEQRIQTILTTRTGRLEDVIAAERELARIREEIERYEGRLRFLRERLAMSTLHVVVHEPYPIVGRPGTGAIVSAFTCMWRNFVLFTARFIAALGWIIPLGTIALVTWVAVRKLWRRGHAGPSAPPASA